MKIHGFSFTIGVTAALAALATGCSKSSSSDDTPTSETTTVTASLPTPTYDGGFDPNASVVPATTIAGIALDSKKDPKVADFLNTYGDYGYEKGEIFGAPKKGANGELIQKFKGAEHEGTFIEFNGKNPKDKAFHAITKAPHDDKAYAVWGQIGNSFKVFHKTWGFPTSFETSEKIDGVTVYTQEFQHGTVTYKGTGLPVFKKK